MKRVHIPVAVVGALLVGAIGVAESPLAKRNRGTPGMQGIAAAAEESVAVESVRLDLVGRENALGALCEVAVHNSSEKTVEKQFRVAYFSHTGAELLHADHEEDEWTALRLDAGERKVVTQECPFYTARKAQVRWR